MPNSRFVLAQDSISPHVQDYAKAVYALESRAGAAVSTTDLAARVGLTAGSVSAMVRKLSELGLVEHEPYRGVRLTDEGRRVALEVMRHHRLIELFLAEELGMPWDRVHAEAEVLEHVLSEDLEQLIAARFGRVSDSKPDMLRYLADQGITLGDELEVIDRQPFGGPVFVRVHAREQPLGGELACAMRIELRAGKS